MVSPLKVHLSSVLADSVKEGAPAPLFLELVIGPGRDRRVTAVNRLARVAGHRIRLELHKGFIHAIPESPENPFLVC